jgi:hypothetical protein
MCDFMNYYDYYSDLLGRVEEPEAFDVRDPW